MNDKPRIGLIGATGRLGKEICLLGGPQIVASFTSSYPMQQGQEVDVYLDVSSSALLKKHLTLATQEKKPIVIGTTGNIETSLLINAAKSIPVFYAANFSIGMHLLSEAAQILAKIWPQETPLSLEEVHHIHKKDRPSGSALWLSEALSPLRKSPLKITSIRKKEVIGEHTLCFESEEEILELKHTALSRKAFAKGALKAAAFLFTQLPGFYGMKELLLEEKGCFSRQ